MPDTTHVSAEAMQERIRDALADLHLRAAAPDLLAALKLIARSSGFAGGTSVEELQRIARAAIAKAAGK